jgi:membrane-bound serine protease (ClpP class)
MVLFTLLVVLFLTIGLTLIGVEVLFPGVGIVGVLGLVLVSVGAYLAYFWLDTGHRAAGLLCSAAITGIIIWYFRKSKLASKFVLDAAQTGKAPDQQLGSLLGKQGIATTPLKPSGIARIQGKTVDVVSTGDFVDPGEEVRVVQVEGMRVIVELVNSPAKTSGVYSG